MNFNFLISPLHPHPRDLGFTFIFEIIASLIQIFKALYSKGLNILASDEKIFLHIKHLCFISKGLNSSLQVLQKTLLLEMKYNSLLHFSHFILSFITALQ